MSTQARTHARGIMHSRFTPALRDQLGVTSSTTTGVVVHRHCRTSHLVWFAYVLCWRCVSDVRYSRYSSQQRFV